MGVVGDGPARTLSEVAGWARGCCGGGGVGGVGGVGKAGVVRCPARGGAGAMEGECRGRKGGRE